MDEKKRENMHFTPVRRRVRVTLVCSNCKKRKTKCDREKPCANCIRLGIEDDCVYLNKSFKKVDNKINIDRNIKILSKDDIIKTEKSIINNSNDNRSFINENTTMIRQFSNPGVSSTVNDVPQSPKTKFTVPYMTPADTNVLPHNIILQQQQQHQRPVPISNDRLSQGILSSDNTKEFINNTLNNNGFSPANYNKDNNIIANDAPSPLQQRQLKSIPTYPALFNLMNKYNYDPDTTKNIINNNEQLKPMNTNNNNIVSTFNSPSLQSEIKSPLTYLSNHQQSWAKIPTFTGSDAGNDFLQQRNSSTISSSSASIHRFNEEFVNFIPEGQYIQFKRSGASMLAIFNDTTTEFRDIYLKSMVSFRTIAIDLTIKRLETRGIKVINDNTLPQSYLPLRVFETDDNPNSPKNLAKNQKMIHNALLDKFAKYRIDSREKFDSTSNLPGPHLPDVNIFLNSILPFFEKHIFDIVPVFNLKMLKYEVTKFYEDYKMANGDYNIINKRFDHLVYCLILLITKISQLSIYFKQKMSKGKETSNIPIDPNVIQTENKILAIQSNKYIAIINHFLRETKIFRKCTILQSQVLILLRFYFWCAPEDGDGDLIQQSQILMGLIIASCREIGANWSTVMVDGNNERSRVFVKIPFNVRTPRDLMNGEDYLRLFKKIWSFVLQWDRKLLLINGEECEIEKSFIYNYEKLVKNDELDDLSWHEKMINFDYLILMINDLIHDSLTRVNITKIKDILKKIITDFDFFLNNQKKGYEHLHFEFQLMISLFKVNIYHASMINYENERNTMKFYENIQLLWDELLLLTKIMINYFYKDNKSDLINNNNNGSNMNDYTRFYTNKIIELISNKICVILPSFILRSNLKTKPSDYDRRTTMIQYLYNVSSVYFNELGIEYYHCFKKMFTNKISCKILNRPRGLNIWATILEFLVKEIRNDDDKVIFEEYGCKLSEYLPYLKKLDDNTTIIDKDNVMKVWNNTILPINTTFNDFEINLHENEINEIFKNTPNNYGKFNMFASFYDYIGTQLANSTEKMSDQQENEARSTKNELEDFLDQFSWNPKESHSNTSLSGLNTSSINNNNPLYSSSTTTTDTPTNNRGGTNNPLNNPATINESILMLEDMFEPLDFLSFF